jgi:hypothetical protein
LRVAEGLGEDLGEGLGEGLGEDLGEGVGEGLGGQGLGEGRLRTQRLLKVNNSRLKNMTFGELKNSYDNSTIKDAKQ